MLTQKTSEPISAHKCVSTQNKQHLRLMSDNNGETQPPKELSDANQTATKSLSTCFHCLYPCMCVCVCVCVAHLTLPQTSVISVVITFH